MLHRFIYTLTRLYSTIQSLWCTVYTVLVDLLCVLRAVWAEFRDSTGKITTWGVGCFVDLNLSTSGFSIFQNNKHELLCTMKNTNLPTN